MNVLGGDGIGLSMREAGDDVNPGATPISFTPPPGLRLLPPVIGEMSPKFGSTAIFGVLDEELVAARSAGGRVDDAMLRFWSVGFGIICR